MQAAQKLRAPANENFDSADDEHRSHVAWIFSNLLVVAEGEGEIEYGLTNAIDAILSRASSKTTEITQSQLDDLLNALRAARRGAIENLEIDPLTIWSGLNAAEVWLRRWAEPAATRASAVSKGKDLYDWLKILRNISHTAALMRDIASRQPADAPGWLA
jgi:hypothetical protein